MLASCEGVGATLGSVILAVLAGRGWYRRILWAGLVLAEVSVLAFALSPGAVTAALALFCMGLGVAGFSTMQTTLIYVSVPAAARGRVMGLVSFCVGMAPLGILNLGILAGMLGPRAALLAIACAGLTSLGVLALLQARVRYHE